MIYINDIPSFRDPEKEILTIDDRIEKIELLGGAIAQDLGRVEAGDVLSLKCLFTRENYLKLESLWLTRAKVNYTDNVGVVWQNMRLKITQIEREPNFLGYIFVTFELWRC